MSHTPGPWVVDYDEMNGIYAVTDKPLRKQDGVQIFHSIKICAHDECSYMRTTEDERMANATLIAAAPEMLAALQYTLSGISRIPYDVLDEITKAIAKATGTRTTKGPDE